MMNTLDENVYIMCRQLSQCHLRFELFLQIYNLVSYKLNTMGHMLHHLQQDYHNDQVVEFSQHELYINIPHDNTVYYLYDLV